jgi:hypothetical protein
LDGLEWFSELTEDELSFNEAVRVLCSHGLVEVDASSKGYGTESRGYSMHGCVHSWTIHVLNREWDVQAATLALRCIGSHVPKESEREYWITRRRLVRHAHRCRALLANNKIEEPGSISTLHSIHSLGLLFVSQGNLVEAEEMYKHALQGREKILSQEHISTLETVNSLGILYKN